MIQHIAPCIVDIGHNRVPVAVHDLNHIALRILDVQICGSVVRHRRRVCSSNNDPVKITLPSGAGQSYTYTKTC